jgi:hypothetical protein
MMDQEGKFNERDALVKKFAHEFVCFNHDVNNSYPYLVIDVTDDCMIELEGMSGLFAPDLFKRVIPTASKET